jgi:hypothetical protein
MSGPTLARTHHPSTAAERKQTDDLNAQQLALAQQPMQQQASAETNTAAPAQPSTVPAEQQSAPAEQSAPAAQPSPATPQQPNAQPAPENSGSSPQQ